MLIVFETVIHVVQINPFIKTTKKKDMDYSKDEG